MTINRDFAENLRAGGDLSGSFDVTGDLATFDNLTVNTAATVPYDNSVSGLTAANIQSAITELNTLVGGGNVGSQATWNVYEFTTVGNDTSFDISTQGSPAPSYVPGYVKVYLNGLLLSESDYTAVDGSTVNFSPAIVDSGQIVSIVVMDSFNTAELLRVTSIDASASTNTLVIDSSSRVGIGTTSPFAKLSISGTSATANDQGIFQITDGTGANTDTKIVMGVVNSDYSWIQSVKPGTDNLDLILNPNGGNVGIGTTSPATTLHLSSTGSNAYSSTITKGTNHSGITVTQQNNTDDMVGIYFATGLDEEGTHWSGITGSRSDNASHWGTQLNFYTHANDLANINDATQKMVIKGDGNVGIGTQSPNQWASYTDSAATVLQVQDTSQRARIVINGGNGAHLDLVDYAGGTNDKHLNFAVDGGISKFGSLNDTGSAWIQEIILSMDLGSGILGVGGTPNDGWGGYRAIQIGPRGSLNANSSTAVAFMGLTNNGYYDGTNWRYIAGTIPPTMFQLTPSGTFSWHQYTAGAADDIIPFDQVMTLTADGNLSFADGGGIDFSAMTGGGTYPAGTGTSVLNDYEEGTFTPNFTIGGTTFTGFSTNSGRYVKIGDQVTVWIYSISTTGIGGLTGDCDITNLPFVSASSNPDVWKGWTNRTGVNPGTGKSLAMFLNTNTAILSFYISDDAGGVNNRMTHSSLPTSGTFEIPVSLTYRAKP